MFKKLFKNRNFIPKVFFSSEPIQLSYTTFENKNSGEIPLIILHGLFGSKINWNTVSRHILDGCKTLQKIISVDVRNHGHSPHTDEHSQELMVEDIRKLMNDLSLKSVILLGHSMGGRAVMGTALTYPDMVSSLIVVDVSVSDTEDKLQNVSNTFKLLLSIDLNEDIPMAQMRKKVDAALSKGIATAYTRIFLIQNLIKTEHGYKWKCNLPVLHKYMEEDIGTFSQRYNGLTYNHPTFFICGANSKFFLKEDIPNTQIFFPTMNLAQVPNSGHFPHSENRKEFVRLVTEFLNGL